MQSRLDWAWELYLDGDDAAFDDVVYHELRRRLVPYVLRKARSLAAAEDAFHQTLHQLLEYKDSYLRGAPVLALAFAIVRNLVADWGRRRAREKLSGEEIRDVEEPSPEPNADVLMALKEDERELRRALEALPDKYREPFELVKLDGLSIAEVADVLGITEGMVKTRAHRAKVAIEEALGRSIPDPRAPPEGDGGAAPEGSHEPDPFPSE